MVLFGALPGMLTGPVGENLTNDPQDIKTVQRHLGRLGYFKDDAASDFITRALDEGIKNFQTDHDLRVDGILRPGGETERRLFERIAGGSADNVFGSKGGADRHVGFGGDVSGTFAGADAPSTPPPRPEKKPRTPSVNSALQKANEELEEFDNKNYTIASKFLRHYLDASGKPVKMSGKDIDGARVYRKAIQTNQKRFEDSIAKGLVDEKWISLKGINTSRPSSFKRDILNMKDGETVILDNPAVEPAGDMWDRDIGRIESVWKDPDYGLALGAVKLRSLGNLQATRNGDKVTITGEVFHTINDLYDFNDDTLFDKTEFKQYRLLAKEGYAKPFRVYGHKPQKVTGTLEIKNGRIEHPIFKWTDIKE